MSPWHVLSPGPRGETRIHVALIFFCKVSQRHRPVQASWPEVLHPSAAQFECVRCIHTYILTYFLACIDACMHASTPGYRYIRTYVHTHLHTYIHTYIPTYCSKSRPGRMLVQSFLDQRSGRNGKVTQHLGLDVQCKLCQLWKRPFLSTQDLQKVSRG